MIEELKKAQKSIQYALNEIEEYELRGLLIGYRSTTCGYKAEETDLTDNLMSAGDYIEDILEHTTTIAKKQEAEQTKQKLRKQIKDTSETAVSYTHLTLPTIYSV